MSKQSNVQKNNKGKKRKGKFEVLEEREFEFLVKVLLAIALVVFGVSFIAGYAIARWMF